MTDLRQAAQQALEALDCINSPLYVREINKVGAAMSALRAALAETDRRALQAEGKHPAPCARHCEAKAFEIEIRMLKAAMKQEPVGYLPAYELDRLQSGHDGRLRSAKFGASVLDGDVAVYTAPPQQAEPVQEPVAWVPVTEALPKSGVKVLACYRNRLGNLRRIRAMWTAAKTEEADSDDAEACSEYDEATDTYYVTEGWYECIDNWVEYSSVAVCEGEVTHWMPLPPDPDTAPPQRPAEPVQRNDEGERGL